MGSASLKNSITLQILILTFAVCSTVCQNSLSEPSCASIHYFKNFTAQELILHLNQPMDGKEIENKQIVISEGVRVDIGKNYKNIRSCGLLLCVRRLFYTECATLIKNSSIPEHWYSNTKTVFRQTNQLNWPPDLKSISDPYYISYAICRCTDKVLRPSDCEKSLCQVRGNMRQWNGTECAVLHKESGCETCIFGSNLIYSDSKGTVHQIKSAIVRPGCALKLKQQFPSMAPQEYMFTGLVETKDVEFWPNMLIGCDCGYNLYNNTSTSKHEVSFTEPVIQGSSQEHDTKETTVSSNNNANTKYQPTKQTTQSKSSNSTRNLIINVALVAAAVILTILGVSVFRKVKQPKTLTPATTPKFEPKSSYERLKEELVLEIILEFQKHVNMKSVNVTNDLEVCSVTDKLRDICNADQLISRHSIIITNHNQNNPVGSGEFGVVYKGMLKLRTGSLKTVAVKRLNIQQTLISSFMREVETFVGTNEGHINVIKFYGACAHSDGMYLLTEYCSGGSLRQHLLDELQPKYLASNGTQQRLAQPRNLEKGYVVVNWETECHLSFTRKDLQQMLLWCKEIATGMQFLGAQKIIHVDLAARNILLSEKLTAKICDLGLSKKCLNEGSAASSIIMDNFPINSYAPEFILREPTIPHRATLYIDIWAYGCLLWEMFTLGCNLYPDATEPGLLRLLSVRSLLKEGYRHPKPVLAPEIVYEKMLECWNETPRSRPSFSNLRGFFSSQINNVNDHQVTGDAD